MRLPDRNLVFQSLFIGSPLIFTWVMVLGGKAATLEPHDFVPVVVFLVVMISGAVLVRRVDRLSFYPRLLGRIAGSAVFVAGAGLLQMQSCALCTNFTHSISSPDGRHLVRISEFDMGAADDFHTSVDLRSKWAFRSKEAFLSESAPGEISVRWIDDSHLLVNDPNESHYPGHRHSEQCNRHVDGIEISCGLPADGVVYDSPETQAFNVAQRAADRQRDLRKKGRSLTSP